MDCTMCACYSCSQRENCAQNGCEGSGCTRNDLYYFKSDCDDWEQDIYAEENDDWGEDDEDED